MEMGSGQDSISMKKDQKLKQKQCGEEVLLFLLVQRWPLFWEMYPLTSVKFSSSRPTIQCWCGTSCFWGPHTVGHSWLVWGWCPLTLWSCFWFWVKFRGCTFQLLSYWFRGCRYEVENLKHVNLEATSIHGFICIREAHMEERICYLDTRRAGEKAWVVFETTQSSGHLWDPVVSSSC